jgi:hypothetical protein
MYYIKTRTAVHTIAEKLLQIVLFPRAQSFLRSSSISFDLTQLIDVSLLNVEQSGSLLNKTNEMRESAHALQSLSCLVCITIGKRTVVEKFVVVAPRTRFNSMVWLV